MYRHLNVRGDSDPVDVDRFKSKQTSKTSNTNLLFLTGETGNNLLTNGLSILAPNPLTGIFGGLNVMKRILNLDKTPSAREQSREAAAKLKSELMIGKETETVQLTELSSSAKDIQVKTREAPQNTYLDMQTFLEIGKALEIIQSELTKNISELTEIDRGIKKITKS